MAGNSFGAKSTLRVGDASYEIFRLDAVEGSARLPFSLKVLLENLLRNEGGIHVSAADVTALAQWNSQAEPDTEIAYTPARVLMQDFTGVPCIVDLATMREAMVELGGDPKKINPLSPAQLVIDHSIIAERFGRPDSFELNSTIEYERNQERYEFLRWGQQSFTDFAVVPPNTGIVHQVNIEHLASVVFTRNGQAYPDTLVGTDSHTTMVNGLGVLGWGVGGIEAEAAMLGQPVSMLIPRIVGFKLTGELPAGCTATDLVLVITEQLRKHGVVGKIVEFYGEGVVNVTAATRTTIGNMSPEYGSTAAVFPIDDETLEYLRLTGRSEEQIALVGDYAKLQGLWHDPSHTPDFSEFAELDMGTVVPSLSGPARPQDRVPLSRSKEMFGESVKNFVSEKTHDVQVGDYTLKNGAVAVAAITSCTNTSNPYVMIGAALLAKKAVEAGLSTKPWVKTTLAPGSKVVMDYYDRAGLTPYLDKLGFNLVGYGCTTCIGNSGPLPTEVSAAVNEGDLAVVSVLSGNRNFEGRINPDVKMNYLASPPLVVAYALAGTMDVDLATEPLGTGADGRPVMLADVWPTEKEVADTVASAIGREMFVERYADVFAGDARWQAIEVPAGDTFQWSPDSTYVRKPPYFDGMPAEPAPLTDVVGARVLAFLGDSVTTDHISPAGNIKKDSPAGRYLTEHGVASHDFNSYGSRRGNHEVMIRGTFANIRLRNKLTPGIQGGVTKDHETGETVAIYDASSKYMAAGTPLVVLAGKEYGSGSSRDWAAKGTALLGVRMVIAESYERIHRSNLIGMGVLPLQFMAGDTAESLGLTGDETFTLRGVAGATDGVPRTLTVEAGDKTFEVTVRIDTPGEQAYYRHGGILPYVLRSLVSA